VIDVDNPLASGGAYHVAQQRLAVLERAAAQVVAM
jgi:hypothetical protein